MCGEWHKNSNPLRERAYCSRDCRIEAGVLPNGVVVGTSSPLEWEVCPCGESFYRPGKAYCSDACEATSKRRRCPDCPALLAKNQQRCDDCRAIRKAERRRAYRRPDLRKYRKRARYHGVDYEPINRKTVFERDNWICGICHEPVNKDLKYPDLMSASLDHITPMARGGPHLYDNVQCAHFLCNSVKSDQLDFELVS